MTKDINNVEIFGFETDLETKNIYKKAAVAFLIFFLMEFSFPLGLVFFIFAIYIYGKRDERELIWFIKIVLIGIILTELLLLGAIVMYWFVMTPVENIMILPIW